MRSALGVPAKSVGQRGGREFELLVFLRLELGRFANRFELGLVDIGPGPIDRSSGTLSRLLCAARLHSMKQTQEQNRETQSF